MKIIRAKVKGILGTPVSVSSETHWEPRTAKMHTHRHTHVYTLYMCACIYIYDCIYCKASVNKKRMSWVFRQRENLLEGKKRVTNP